MNLIPLSNSIRLPGLVAAAALALWCSPAQAQNSIPLDDQSAVIFTYHHIGDDLAPSGNLEKDQFEEQIKELTTGNYHVLPLPQIVETLKSGGKLPNPAIALTFDSAHRNTLNYAAPLLIKARLPFTIFVATDTLDNNTSDSLHWDDIKRLTRSDLVTIGLHPASYQRLFTKGEAEISRQINNAVARYRTELGREPKLFAYPYGEYSLAYKKIIERQGFQAAFGQQSGVAYAGADMFALPRFSMTSPYGDIDRFRMTALALPLPVQDVSPQDPYVIKGVKPEIGFTIDEKLKNQVKTMSCFSSTPEKAKLQTLSETRIEIRLEKPFEDERGRINCTMPGSLDENTDQPRWRWYGMLLTMPVNYDDYEPAASEDSAAESNIPNDLESTVE